MRPWPSRATRGVSWGACLRHQTRNSPAPLEWAMPVQLETRRLIFSVASVLMPPMSPATPWP